MKRLILCSAIVLAVTFLAVPTTGRLAIEMIGSIVPPAGAIVGAPLTPMSYAGVARRTAYRTTAAVAATSAAAASEQEAAAAQQQAAAAQQQQAQAQAAAAATPATVVTALPSGCTSVPSGGTSYFNCAGTYYKPYMQGGNLIYAVVPKP